MALAESLSPKASSAPSSAALSGSLPRPSSPKGRLSTRLRASFTGKNTPLREK